MKSNNILFVLNSNGVGGAEVSVKRMVADHFKDSHVLTMWNHPNYQEGFWNSLEPNYTHLVDERLGLITFIKSLIRLKEYLNNSELKIIQTQLKGADLILGLFKMVRLIPSNVKLVSCVHNSYSYYYEGSFLNKIVGSIHRFFISNYFEKVIVISRQDLEDFESSFKNQLIVIENSIQIPTTRKTSQYSNLSRDNMVISMIGNIKLRKGYDRLADLVNLLESDIINFQINIAGGIEDQSLFNSILELGNKTKNVTINYVGKISNIFDFLRDSDLLLSLSREEGLPISILEAMSVNLPLVLSDISGHRLIIPELISDRILFQSIEEARDIIINKFQSNELLEKELKLQFSQLIERFDFESMCEKYEDVYQSIN